MLDEGRAAGLPKLLADPFNCAGVYSDRSDKSGCAVNGIMLDDKTLVPVQGAFKTPSLRNLVQTAPYFHTGEELTLDEVVDHYDEGGDQDGLFTGTVDPNVQRLGLTDEEKEDLLSFLQTLEGVALPSSLETEPTLPD
jgi:cytochrome c peroxidase